MRANSNNMKTRAYDITVNKELGKAMEIFFIKYIFQLIFILVIDKIIITFEPKINPIF